MKARSLLFFFCALGLVRAQVDPGVTARRAASFQLLTLSRAADVAVKSWLLTHQDREEDIGARRYFYGDIDGDGAKDLLLVTDLAPAAGNWGSVDFVLILAHSPDQPIVFHFGGVGARRYASIMMDAQGIRVNALYYGPADADCCPSVKRQVLFVLKNGALVERTEK